jgi:hypothetical protein
MLPSAQPGRKPIQVARRALALAAVVCRGDIERGAGQTEADAIHHRLLDWLTDQSLWPDVESVEAAILRAPLGTLQPQDVIRAIWHAEGLVVLAWALSQFAFPAHDQEVDPYAVADAVGLFSPDADAWTRTARLRDSAELEGCRELLYAIHVRLRDFLRHRTSKDFTDRVENSWIDALGIDPHHLIVDNDLAIDGKAIIHAEESRIQDCEHIICERHRAIIWLVDGETSYSLTPTDT